MLYKSCRDLQQKSIVPTHLPYVVSLVRFYETDCAIYLQLQHAAGGRLWSYVGAYLSQQVDAANICYNVELHQTADNVESTKIDRRESDLIGSSANIGNFPASADSRTVSTSAACAKFDESDLKSKLSLSDMDSVDESHEPVNRKFSAASSPECLSQGFGEVLWSTNPEMKYFRIDSRDSSEHASRQLSSSSTEDNFCHVHLTVASSGVCRLCSETATPQPAVSSASCTDNREETSIYETSCSETVDKSQQRQEAVGNVYDAGDDSAGVVGGHTQKLEEEVDQSWCSPVVRNSRERSFDSCSERHRRRTLSSAFGELDLAASTTASNMALPRPVVHLPESCIRQWAAEMVVAISRLHSIGIICRQVDLSCSKFNVQMFVIRTVLDNIKYAVIFSFVGLEVCV